MLKPRETDIPALFLFFVVFPLVAYYLLGRWSELSKKKETSTLLANCDAEESFRAESMTAATLIPLVPLTKVGIHECARCYAPSTTRCSRCKSVRYCSGRCQIMHWRQVHKHECQQLEYSSSSSSPKILSDDKPVRERVLFDDNLASGNMQGRHENATTEYMSHQHVSAASLETAACITPDASDPYLMERSVGKQVYLNSKKEKLRKEDETILESSEDACRRSGTVSKEAGNQLGENESNEKMKANTSSRRSTSRKMNDTLINGGRLVREGTTCNDEVLYNCSSEGIPTNRSIRAKSGSHVPGTKMNRLTRSKSRASIELSSPDMERKDQRLDVSEVGRPRGTAPQEGSEVPNTGFSKTSGLMRSTKHERLESTEVKGDTHKKTKMLFPYEDFVKFFQCRTFNLSPRGLVNCGNSCYANAVLQCLTYTKPLTIFFLRRTHSRTCCSKDWCLMCELEQHVAMLTESGGPLSPSRLLSHMGSINRHISYGSQEDAHEFLRYVVTSMQSICLEKLGGENKLDTKLQETTFIHHTFGGRLISKVKCLRCYHESERSEIFMDLTLEIFGWVESLQDALTQFTSAEALDGDNMYKCGRCAEYVRAEKKLCIQEAPNILTIVLKRFQEGNYGKINKCITFPEMLDMIPFMTGADDIPPLYILYAVVVHIDMLNAAFSGHYITYLKDMQGSWFRIDDTEVQPVEMSQVMSEGAYILFYMRSSPRPGSGQTGSLVQHQSSGLPKQRSSKTQKLARLGHSRSNSHFVSSEPSAGHRPEMPNHPYKWIHSSSNSDIRAPYMDNYPRSRTMDFSDATSSDWSIFTSSDDASFTTDSTRDSFSTVDHADAGNMDLSASLFNSFCAPEYPSHKTVSCSRFSSSKFRERFVHEENGNVYDSGNDDKWNQVSYPSS
ncbi:hypothetical protein ACET3Z_020526 [Daucus carota]